MTTNLLIQAQQQVSNAIAIANTRIDQPFSWVQTKRVQTSLHEISQWRFALKQRVS